MRQARVVRPDQALEFFDQVAIEGEDGVWIGG
jgi:hypothetical protein